MNLRRVFLALSLSAISYPLAAAELPSVESTILANGLEIVVIPNHRLPAVSHMLWLRVGAADDPRGKSGLAHYHEHMMFQGTANYKSGEYAETITREGGQENAFTGKDATAYFVNIAKEKLPQVMALEADRMRGLTPGNDDAAKEKEVIIEERRARIENNPQGLFSEAMDAALWRNHPYRMPAIGWMHEMQKLSKDDVLRFHQTWYHPNNAVLVLSGDITLAEARTLAERYYGDLPRGAVPARQWNDEPPQQSARRLVMHSPNVRQPVWMRNYQVSSLGWGNKNQGLPLLILSQLAGGGKTSALYQALVEEKKLASDVSVSYDTFTLGPSVFRIIVLPEPGISMERIENAVNDEIARMLKDGFKDEDITRAKTLLKAQAIYARDGLAGVARVMGWIRMIGLDKDFLFTWPNMIEAVKPADIMAAAKENWNLNASVTGELLSVEGKKE